MVGKVVMYVSRKPDKPESEGVGGNRKDMKKGKGGNE